MMTLRRNIIKNVLLLAGFALSSGYVDLSRDKTSSQGSTRYCQSSVCDPSNAVDRDENTCTGIRVIYSVLFKEVPGYVELSTNKTTSQSSTWSCSGPTCENLFVSSNAVDRDERTCTRNIDIGGSSVYKTVWWRVDMGDIYSIYSIGILFKDIPGYEDRQRGRFAGFSLYLSESGNRDNNSRCYKDGPNLPPLNFTTTCTGYGRYVIFYNERLDGVQYPEEYESQSYTELCEVIVKGCNETFYGRNCNRKCSVNCENERCNIENGTCLRCMSGWTGHSCENKCSSGRYGLDCKQLCSSHCINNEVCNHVTGSCDNGCAAQWMGINCDEPCGDGNYGPGCIYNCSGHCLDGAPCNKQTGQCETGCKPGYTANLCNTACFPGYFGNQCKELCSQNCLNDDICNYIDGECKNGCKDGYIGKRCEKSCQEGYYGRNCSDICSPKCITACQFTDGSCDCAPGWRSSSCSEECLTGDFGVNCQHRCSGHCIQNESCSRFDGTCTKGCKPPYRGLTCEYNYDETNHTVITIGFGVSLTINLMALAAFAFLFRGRLFKIFRRHNNERPPDANVAYETQNIQEVSVNKSDYQELTASRENNEYQSIQASDIRSPESGNT